MKARLPEGYGKQSQKQMMDRLNKMQADMQAKQDELHSKEYSAKAGGGMVEAMRRRSEVGKKNYFKEYQKEETKVSVPDWIRSEAV